jgi:hypothetical protein
MAQYLHLYETESDFAKGYQNLDIESMVVEGESFTPSSLTFNYLTRSGATFPEGWLIKSGEYSIYRSSEGGYDMLSSGQSIYDMRSANPIFLLSSATFEYTNEHYIDSWPQPNVVEMNLFDNAYVAPWVSYTNENELVTYNAGNEATLYLKIKEDKTFSFYPISMEPGFVSVSFSKGIDEMVLENYLDKVKGEKLTIKYSDGREDKILPYVISGTYEVYDNEKGEYVEKEGLLSPTFFRKNYRNGEEDLSIFDEVLYSYPVSNYYTGYFGYKYRPLLEDEPWCCSFFVNGKLLDGPCMQ